MVSDSNILQRVIQRSAELHLAHICGNGDPFELGSARPLDFGHWAAHKLESITDHRLRHGEAVAIGLALDLMYSVRMGFLNRAVADRIIGVLEAIGFSLWDDALLERDAHGRHVLIAGLREFREHLGGDLHITLLRGIGDAFEVTDMDEAAVLDSIEDLAAGQRRSMRVRDRFHLTYCSNIHPGESWPEVSSALGAALPSIRRRLSAEGPLAIGLRLSARAAEELEQPVALAAFRAFLDDGDYYVPTMNGFPYGAFHGQRVKEQVYLPDWREPARIAYTNRLASLLARLLDTRIVPEGSVSTVPGAFKAHLRSAGDARAIAAGILEHAAHLVRLRDETGVTIALAIEPEPSCFVETVAEAVDFFTAYLFDDALVASLARQGGYALSVDEVRRHIGVCFDACHMAVEFEEPGPALLSLARAGIRVPKFQISSALQVANPVEGSPARAALARFAEDTYLHQVVERSDGRLTRYSDLPAALASPASDAEREWRIHFHVPIFLEAMGDLDTTQAYLGSVIDLVKQTPGTTCLEVETYTWDVLPPEYRTEHMNAAIARELAWTRARLES